MNDLIQKLIEIDSLDAQIQSLRLENPDSTRIAPRKEKCDRLLKEAFTALGREYYRNATWTPASLSDSSISKVESVVELSPGTTKNLDVDWLIEHIDDGYDFDEIYKEAEEDGLNTFYFFYLRELLEEQQINIDLLRGLSRGDLRKLLTEKITEYDFLVQKAGFAELLEDAESNAYHVKRMVVLLKEAAAAIAASGSNPEILAKLQGYVDLSN
jgi:hypothetical protein